MTTYDVLATRNEGWWTLTVADVPGAISQVRRLDQAEPWIREAIRLVLDVEDFEIRILPRLPNGAGERVHEIVERRQRATAELDAAQRDQEVAVHALRKEGLTMRDIAVLLELSHQRVAQIARG